MATSGTYSFNYNTLQIINSAARKIGAIASGETLSSAAIQDFQDALNILVKALDATGLHIWTEEEATLFLQPNQIEYTVGGSTTDNAAWATIPDVQTPAFTPTTLAGAVNAGASTISVASATGFAASYYVGVVLNSGSIFWSTESGAPSGTTITLTTPLSGAAAAGSAVYVYPTQIIRPLRIVGARRLAFSGLLETPMILMSRLDYRNLPNKSSPGTVTQLFYDPRGGASSQGVIWVWPAPPDATSAVNFTWWRPIQDFDANGNIPDLPVEWIDALVWNLAYKMALEYDCPAARYQMIQQQAAAAADNVRGWDREAESYMFGFNTDQTGP